MDPSHTTSGWLFKWTNVIKGYQKRWFLVQNNLLSYYRNPQAVGRSCRGTFELQNANLETRPSQTSFILTEHSGRKHHLKAVSEKDKAFWITTLSAVIKSANLVNDNESDTSSIDSNFITSNQRSEPSSHDMGGSSTTRHPFFRSRRRHPRKQLTAPISSPNLPQEAQGGSSSPVYGFFSSNRAHARHPLKVRPAPDEPILPVSQLADQSVVGTNESPMLPSQDSTDDMFPAAGVISRFLRQCSSTDLGFMTKFLASVGDFQRRLIEHTQSVCSQITSIESMLTNGQYKPSTPPLPHKHLQSAAQGGSPTSKKLLNIEQVVDSSKRTVNAGSTNCATPPAIAHVDSLSILPSHTVDLKTLLADHRMNVKDFEKTCMESLKYVVVNVERWHRRVQTEQERCLALERTVEQLARQHRALEQQLSNCYINTSPSSTTKAATSDDDSDFRQGSIRRGEGTLQRVKKSSLQSYHSVYYETPIGTEDDEFYDASSCEDDLELNGEKFLKTAQSTSFDFDKEALEMSPSFLIPTKPSTSRARCGVEIFSSTSLESLANVDESSDSISEDYVRPDTASKPSIHKPKTTYQKSEKTPDSAVTRVRRTTIPYSPKVALNLWSIIKNGIGRDITKIPLPVNFNEPISFLQRASEDLAYSALLDQASECKDPGDQMALMAAFAVSCYATTAVRTGKPFNPLLGETFEFDRTMEEEYGWRLITEQVSHHPPGSALHCESLRHGWTLWLEFVLSSKFRGKYMTVVPNGTVHVLLPDGSRYSWTKVTTVVHNLIVGSLWIDNYGEALVSNHTNGYKCLLRFVPHSYFSRGPQKQVVGDVQNAQGTTELLVRGSWDSHIESQRISPTGVPTEEPKLLWTAESPLPDADKIYNFTRFAVALNEPEENVAPTDSRLRPDQRFMEDGLLDQANEEKRRLEAKQRTVRHRWEEAQAVPGANVEPLYTPRWFSLRMDPVTGVSSHVYLNNYWQAKAKQDWSNCLDIF